MASIPGARYNLTGASGSQGLLAPRESWKNYVLPRGGYASQASAGTRITFDSASVAARFAANNWIQVGLNTANIRQVAAVGGNSITVSGSAVTVAQNDRVFLIGNTQPTVVGGSATYTVPASFVRQRDDDAADLYTNSMVTTDANGLVQFFSDPNTFDVLVQDANGSLQASIIDLEVGSSTSTPSVVSNLTVNGNLGVTGTAVFGSTVTINAILGVTGWAFFGSTVTMHAALGVTGHGVFGATLTVHGRFGVTGQATFGQTATFSGSLQAVAGISAASGFTLSTGFFGVSQQPRCLLYATSSSFTIGANSISIMFDGEAFDIGGLHTGTTAQIIIPAGAGGVYMFYANIVGGSAAGAGGESRSAYINKNVTQTICSREAEDKSTNAPQTFNLSALDLAAPGDRYELVARFAAGAGVLGGTRSQTHFWAAKLF